MALTVAPVRVRKGSGLRVPDAVASAFDPYPIDDATPMTSSQEQYDAMTYSRAALRSLMEAKGGSYILKADFGLYYKAVDPALRRRAPHVAPDVMLTLDAMLPPFTPYRLWEVGKAPDLVLEITSPSTKAEDVAKRGLYAQLGVTEYWQYEPHGPHLTPGLECCRLAEGRYVRVSGTYCYELGALWLWSRVLGTAWGLLDTGELRLWDPARKAWFPTEAGREAQLDQAERERDRAKQERDRAKQERDRAKRERQQAEQERDRAQREVTRLEAEIRRLHARMAGLDSEAAAK